MEIYFKLLFALLSVFVIPQKVSGEISELSINGFNVSEIEKTSPTKRELPSQHEPIASLGPVDPEKIMTYLYHVLNKRSDNDIEAELSPAVAGRQRRMMDDDESGSEEARRARFRANKQRMQQTFRPRRPQAPGFGGGSSQQISESIYENFPRDDEASSSQDIYATVDKVKKMRDREQKLRNRYSSSEEEDESGWVTPEEARRLAAESRRRIKAENRGPAGGDNNPDEVEMMSIEEARNAVKPSRKKNPFRWFRRHFY